ncbi:MAG: Flp family type IVb pilin [Rhizobiaceae bacterium]|nr:Flp family type IVb pilin [Rhizobiaceae bacterium]
MKNLFARFMNDESGATAIEYGLIAGLIAVAIITGATSLGGSLNSMFGDLSDTIDGTPTG